MKMNQNVKDYVMSTSFGLAAGGVVGVVGVDASFGVASVGVLAGAVLGQCLCDKFRPLAYVGSTVIAGALTTAVILNQGWVAPSPCDKAELVQSDGGNTVSVKLPAGCTLTQR